MTEDGTLTASEAAGYPRDAESKCPAFEIPAWTTRVFLASALLEDGALRLEDFDAWYLEAVQLARLHVSDLMRDERAAKQEGQLSG